MSICIWKNRALAIALAGTAAIALLSPASSAPVLANAAALKQALPSDVQDVRWRGGGAFFGGLVVGGLIGAAIARPYYYGYPAYGYGYGYGYVPYYDVPPSPYYCYACAYPYGGYYGGYSGYGWRGYGWRGAYLIHHGRVRRH